MKRSPLLSIGLPVFNGQPYLREALDSLLGQTCTDFELIISDNASTDDTEDICREYARTDPRIAYHRQATNIGALGNFEYVLNQATGEYFMWAAADDKWDPHWIETLLPVAMQKKCLAFGYVQAMASDGTEIPHPANLRSFHFAGSRLSRRIKFFLEPAHLGKGNPIYGIFPRYAMTADVISGAKTSNLDLILLYNLLKSTEILPGGTARLFKRIAPIQFQSDSQALKIPLGKALCHVKRIIASSDLPRYYKESNSIERILMIFFFPALFGLLAIMAIKELGNRKLGSKN